MTLPSEGAACPAAAPMTEAVATGDTLVYPVQAAPPPPPCDALAPEEVVRPVPLDPVVDVSIEVTVPVAVAVLLAGAVADMLEIPDIPDTVAVPANTTGEAQPHTNKQTHIS